MNEDTSVSQHSPILNDNNQVEMMNTSLVDENEIKEPESQSESTEKNLIDENNEPTSVDEHTDNLEKNLEDNSDKNRDVNLEEHEQLNKDNKITELANLNDDISDDENFKEDELDFEEGDNSRGNIGDEKKQTKAAEEDGEVNSEEELEDGEVKEEDSDEELDEQHEDDLNKPTPANLNSLCRFYSKGQCTWGANCRFIHQKPMGTSQTYSPKINQINQPKPNLSNKPIEILNKNPIYSKHNNPQPQTYTKLMSNSYYNQTDNQYERNMKYVKKDTTYSKTYNRNVPADDLDYDQPMPPSNKNKYHQPPTMDERSPVSNYSRNTSAYYTSSSKHHLSHQSPNQVSSSNYRSSSTRPVHNSQQQQTHSDETEYERKRRLAFESAPWNEGADQSPSLQHSTRSSPLDRHSQSSGSKLYSSNKYSSKQIDNTAEQYYDPWRRSKSPYNNSRQQSTGQIYHHSRSKSKSESGSNEFSDPELIEQQYSHKKRLDRLDPEYVNKHRPSSYRDNNGNGENSSSYHHHHHSSSTYDRLDHPSSSTSQNKKSSYYKEPVDDLPQTPSSSYQKGNTTPIPERDEIDIPNYERPKNIPRTRKDSWSDTDTEESCSSNSSYSESGSESENSDNDEPYSRTNKFESTREVGSKLKGDDVFNSSNEPQNKRQRTISDHSRLSSKHEFSKSRSPYSPSNESPSYRYSSGRKKQSVNVNSEIGSPFFNQDALESSERTSKHLENRNGGNDDNKKTELLEQLKSIEEAIARKRLKTSK